MDLDTKMFVDCHMKKLVGKKLLLFDLDGTLIDSLPDLADAVNHVRNHYNFAPLDSTVIKHKIGHGVFNLVKSCLPELAPKHFEDALAAFQGYYSAHSLDKTIPFRGVAETLLTLASSSRRLVVVTNKDTPNAQKVLSTFELDRYFNYIIGADQVAHSKPAPDLLLKALALFEIHPEEAIMIGDSGGDCLAAKAAGLDFIACLYGYSRHGELEPAAATITEFSALNKLG